MKDKNLTPKVSPIEDRKKSENQYPKEYPAILSQLSKVLLVTKQNN